MKSRIPVYLAASGISMCAVLPSSAADIIKADNLTNLIDGSSWVGGSAPGTEDAAVFDATYTQTGNLDSGGAITWAGLSVTAGTSAINIGNTTPENTLAIGTGGVSLGAARALTLPNTQWLANQVWTAVASSTLTVGATKIDAATFTLQLTSAGMTVKKGVTTLPFGGTSSLSKFVIGDDTLNSQPDAGTVTSAGDLTVSGHFAIGEAAPAVFNQSAGIVNANSPTGGFGAGLNIGHRGGNGTYNLSGGTLNCAAAVTIGAGGGTPGLLNITAGTANLAGLTLKTSDSASATFTLTGGRLNLGSGGINSLANDTNRNINLGGGTLGATNDWSSSLAMTLTGTNGALTVNTLDSADLSSARTITLSGALGGSGGLAKTGAGTLVLSGTNTYSGNTTINGGTLDLSGAGGIYTGTAKAGANSLSISGGGILVGDRWSWGPTQSLGRLNFNNGYISANNGTIRNTAAASNDFQNRGITVGAGGLTVENATANTTWTWLGGTNNTTYAANAALTLTGAGDGIFHQTVSGSGVGLNKTGTGTWVITATNNFTGPVTITGGALALGANNVLPNASPITLDSATLNSATFSDTVGTLAVAGASTIQIGTGAALVFADSTSIDWNGGTLALTGTFVSGQSLNFGPGGLTATQLSQISSPGFTDFALDEFGFLIATPAVGYDSWATQITNGKTLRTEDADDDGFSNLKEYLFGTDPMAGEGSLTSTEQSGGTLIIRWKQLTFGGSYALKESGTLANNWVDATGATIETDGSPTGDYQPMKATISIGSGASFFRVESTEN